MSTENNKSSTGYNRVMSQYDELVSQVCLDKRKRFYFFERLPPNLLGNEDIINLHNYYLRRTGNVDFITAVSNHAVDALWQRSD